MPLQFRRPDWQESAQLPPLQTLPPLHDVPAVPPATPHPVVAPQKVRLVLGSTQLPLHSISPGGHETAQRPAAHTWPAAHAVPGAPPSAPQPAVAPQ